MRILSLIPEATEILEALGLGDALVRAPRLDGTTALTWGARDCASSAAVAAAGPTLIFASATRAGGEVPRRMVRKLIGRLQPRPAVYALEPHTLGDILGDIKTVGDATGRQGAARALILALRTRIDVVTLRSARTLARGQAPRIACLAGVSAGGEPITAGWWLAELVGLAGGFDVLHGAGRPPRAVSWAAVEAARPDQLWLPDAAGAPVASGGPTARWASRPARPWPAAPVRASMMHRAGGPEGFVWPGPYAVDLLERFAAWCGPEIAVVGTL